jgi:hypothetical protein
MLKQGNDYAREREKALADGLMDVACELRMVEPADFITFIKTEQFGNLRTLVNSSTEMFFKPGTICFGLSGEIDLGWGRSPCISLDMEFHHMGVSAYFRLVLWSIQAGVEINYVSFKNSSPEPDENTLRLVNAIADARLVPTTKRDRPAGAPATASA